MRSRRNGDADVDGRLQRDDPAAREPAARSPLNLALSRPHPDRLTTTLRLVACHACEPQTRSLDLVRSRNGLRITEQRCEPGLAGVIVRLLAWRPQVPVLFRLLDAL